MSLAETSTDHIGFTVKTANRCYLLGGMVVSDVGAQHQPVLAGGQHQVRVRGPHRELVSGAGVGCQASPAGPSAAHLHQADLQRISSNIHTHVGLKP